MISPSTIQQIIETARIEEVIGEFIVLKRRGSNYVALCPFHTEKTPSFHVSPTKGIYKCFGCSKAGNAVNFLMEHEHYNYPEALRYLAKKYNIEIEETETTPEEEQLADERESLYNILSFAQKYFTATLFETEEGKAIGLTYFEERGFSMQTVNKFQLGYSYDRWEDFTNYAIHNGYKAEYLTKIGLSASRSTINEQLSTNLYDIFRGRVIFPIHNLSGRVIAFGGRILISDKTKPKYINSPESEIYHKSDVLYGIYFAKNSIIKNNNCFLVEGYTDVISLHQSGIENVVASSGTSLTTGQIKLIKRYTPNITILYDGDEAGIKASFRGIDMILQEGMNVRAVLFPDGEDPDSFAKKNRPQELVDYINRNSSDFIAFKTHLLIKETGDDPIKKSNLIKEILNSISLIPDIIIRTEYIKECGKMMSISEQTLINELNRLLTKNAFRGTKTREEVTASEPTEYITEKQIPIDEDIFSPQEKEVIRLLLLYGSKEIVFQMYDPDDSRPEKRLIDVRLTVSKYIISNLSDDMDISGNKMQFNNYVYQKIFEEIISIGERQMKIDENYFTNHPDPEIMEAAIDIFTSPYSLSKNWSDMHNIHIVSEDDRLRDSVKMAIYSLKLKRIIKNIEDIKKILKENPDSGEQDNHLQLLSDLVTIRNKIAAELSRSVLR